VQHQGHWHIWQHTQGFDHKPLKALSKEEKQGMQTLADASSDTLSPYCKLLHLSDDIFWYLWHPMWLWHFGRIWLLGGMALTEQGDLFELWNQVSVSNWQLNRQFECVKQHRMQTDPFETIWEKGWLSSGPLP